MPVVSAMLEPSGLYYPNRFARHFMLAMQEVMGRNGLNAILSMSGLESYIDQLPPDNMAKQFDFAYMAAMSEALEDMYGPRGGRGIALRIGQATFSSGMKNFGALAGMSQPAFKALPMPKRVDLGLKALAAVFTRFTDQQTTIEDNDDHYLVTVDISPMAWGRSIEQPVSHALVGIIRECLRWSSHGYEFHVYELPRQTTGEENFLFKINKTPIGGGSFG